MTSTTHRFRGIINNRILLSYMGTTIIDDILNNRLKLKKMKGSGLLRSRINRSDRVVFTTICIDGDWYLWPLELVMNHDYQKAHILDKNILDSYIKQNLAEVTQQVRDKKYTEIGSENDCFDVEEDDVNSVPLISKNGELITLSHEQEGVLSIQCPLVLSGAPGTGKTLVILAMMLKLASSESHDLRPKKMLYVANSAHLTRDVQILWEEMSKGIEADVSFLDASAGANAFRNDFVGWWQRYKQTKNSFMREHKFLRTLDSTLLYHEFRIISGYTKQYYKGLGEKQSGFSEEQRDALYTLFQSYQAYLKDTPNPDFFMAGLDEKYDLIVVDEGQNLSFAVCRQLASAAKDNNICFCVDSRQDMNGVKSYVRPFLLEHIVSNNHRHLGKSYRNSAPVSALANRLVTAICEREGGITDKNEYASIQQNDDNRAGSVTWSSLEGEALKLRLKQARADLTVVIARQEVITTYASDKSLEGLILLLPEEALGMEFEDVLLINPLSGLSEALHPSGETKMNRAKNGWQGLSNEDRRILNQFYVMLTRAKKDLIINQTSHHNLVDLMAYLKDSPVCSVVSLSSSSLSLSSSSSSSSSSDGTQKREKAINLANTFKQGGQDERALKVLSSVGITTESAPIDDIQHLCYRFIDSLNAAKEKSAPPATMSKSQRKFKPKVKSSSQPINHSKVPIVSVADKLFADFFDRDGIKNHWVAILFSPIILNRSTSCLFYYLITSHLKEYMTYFKGPKLNELAHALREFGIGCSSLTKDKDYPFPLWWLSYSLDTFKALSLIMNNREERKALYQSITYEQLNAFFRINKGESAPVCVINQWFDSSGGLLLISQWINNSQYLFNASEGEKRLLKTMCTNDAQSSVEIEPLKKALLKWLMSKFVLNASVLDIFTVLKSDNALWVIANKLFKSGDRFKDDLLYSLCECIPSLSKEDIERDKELLNKILAVLNQKGSSSAPENEVFSRALSFLNETLPPPSSPSLSMASVRMFTPSKKPVISDKIRTSVLDAIQRGDLKRLKEYSLKKIKVNQIFDNKETSLMIACRNRYLDIITFLLAQGANINLQNEAGCTALIIIEGKGYLDVAKLLIAHPDIDVNLKTNSPFSVFTWSALMGAASRGHFKFVELLLAHPGVDVNLKDNHELTALMLAASNGHCNVVELLLAHPDVDVSLKIDGGWTALMLAANAGYCNVVQLLLAHPDVDVNLKKNNGFTTLMNAAQKGHCNVLKLLLAHPSIDVNLKKNDEWTALMLAVHAGHCDIVKLLLAHPGIDVNLKDNHKWTALMLAANKGHCNVVKLLLARPDVDVNLKINDGWTALMLAASKGDCNVVELLLAHSDVDVNLKINNGWTALMLAAQKGHCNVVELLLARPDVDVNMQDQDDSTAFMLAANEGHCNVVDLLLNRTTIDVNLQNEDGCTALIMAASNGNLDVVKRLLAEKKLDVNLQTNDPSESALMVAAFEEYPDVVELLLTHPDVNVNLKKNDGSTALMLAAMVGDCDIVKLLLAHSDVDVNLQNERGNTALFIAQNKGYNKVVELLSNHDLTAARGMGL